HLAPGGERQAARGGVQRRKDTLLGLDAGARHSVEQRRLAGVGVADDRRRLELGPPPSGPLLVPLRAHLLDLPLEVAHPLADPPALSLDLLLARSAAGPHPTSTAAHLAVIGI